MALSELAQQFADEIRMHDWSDAPYIRHEAGHKRDPNSTSGRLDSDETNRVRTNVMWVVAHVLICNDPKVNLYEFAEACDVGIRRPRDDKISKSIENGLRRDHGCLHRPGTREPDPDCVKFAKFVAEAVEGEDESQNRP